MRGWATLRRRRLAAGAVLTVAVAAAPSTCGGGKDAGAGAVSIQGGEYAFVVPDSVEGVVVSFEYENIGDEIHEFAMGRIAEGKTIEDVKALFASEGGEIPDWIEDVAGVPVLSPGQELGITRELEPGRYVLLCPIPSPQGTLHLDLGMIRTFEVAGESELELPEGVPVIAAGEDAFDVPELESGPRTIELRNAASSEREFNLVMLADGFTTEQAEAFDWDGWFEGGQEGPLPFVFLGAMQSIPPGTSVYLTIDLEAGKLYRISDEENGIQAEFTPR